MLKQIYEYEQQILKQEALIGLPYKHALLYG